jgi:8-oxo-dGTP pyrophosphatase MutT (NUDIX family)
VEKCRFSRSQRIRRFNCEFFNREIREIREMITPFWPGCVRPARIVAGVVLLRPDGSALLQLRDNKPGINAAGQWVFPGGHCEAGEALEAGARREFQEETGYRCVDLRWLTAICHPSDDLEAVYESTMFMSLYDGIQPVRCYEGQAVEFVRREESSLLPMPEYVLPVWDRAIEMWRTIQKNLYGGDKAG